MAFNFAVASDKTYSYRLGTNRHEFSEDDPRGFELLEAVWESETHVTLKRMSQGNRAKYQDAIIRTKSPTITIRQEVAKWVFDTGDVMFEGRVPESVNEFRDKVPLPVIMDIHHELMKPMDADGGLGNE